MWSCSWNCVGNYEVVDGKFNAGMMAVCYAPNENCDASHLNVKERYLVKIPEFTPEPFFLEENRNSLFVMWIIHCLLHGNLVHLQNYKIQRFENPGGSFAELFFVKVIQNKISRELKNNQFA